MALTEQHTPYLFDFTGNPFAFRIRSDYSGSLLIVARLFVEKTYKAGDYEQVQDNYMDPDSNKEIDFYPGQMLQAFFEDTDIVSLFNLSSIMKSETAVKRYYVEFYEYYNDTLNNVHTTSTYYAINGKLPWSEFPNHDWLNNISTEWLNVYNGKIRTWKEAKRYLYFLYTNSTTNDLNLQAKIYYSDGTSETQTVKSFTGAAQYDLLIMPAGYTQLGIGSYSSKDVYKYELSLHISGGSQIGETLTYQLENKPWWGKTFLLLNDRYGTFETLLASGKESRSVNSEKEESKKHVPYSYASTDRQINQRTIKRQKEHTCNTGLMTLEEAERFEKMLADTVFRIDKNSFTPVHITSTNLNTVDETEDMYNVEFTYKLSFEL